MTNPFVVGDRVTVMYYGHDLPLYSMHPIYFGTVASISSRYMYLALQHSDAGANDKIPAKWQLDGYPPGKVCPNGYLVAHYDPIHEQMYERVAAYRQLRVCLRHVLVSAGRLSAATMIRLIDFIRAELNQLG